MKKILSVMLMLSICLSFAACGGKEQSADVEDQPSAPAEAQETETYLLPKSYWDYAGSTLEEAAESFRKLGSDYYTDAKVTDEGVQLELTEQQRDKLIERNDEYSSQIAEEFMSYSEEYRFEPDESYQNVNLYFDEKLPPTTNIKAVFMLTAGYGMNYILKNNTTEWSVRFTIYNCHTGKPVVSASIPDEEATCGPEEWKASYQE